MVFVLSSDQQPLDPCHPARARQLLRRGRARVVRRFPCTIQLVARPVAASVRHGHRLKIDPGSKTTGLAVINEATNTVVWAAELTHRSQTIRQGLQERASHRRQRRARKTRYRPARFANRTRRAGWLAPSLQSRVDHLTTWVRRVRQWCPITALSVELVRFDPQQMVNPEITGVEYQQGTLWGYEVREYLLEKWTRRCAYCHGTTVPLQIEHLIPRSRGGSDRVSNLTLACEPCNQRKGSKTATEYGFPHLLDVATQPLRDAAGVNSTRWALYARLQATGLAVEVGSGGRTKYNRTRVGLGKTHWTDAACVGASTPDTMRIATPTMLVITATGRGLHSRTKLDNYGFPRLRLPRTKRVCGFQTGDIVAAVVTTGTKQGRYVGRVAVRSSGSFNVTTGTATIQGLHQRFFRLVQRSDGYQYAIRRIDSFLPFATVQDGLNRIPPTAETGGSPAEVL